MNKALPAFFAVTGLLTLLGCSSDNSGSTNSQKGSSQKTAQLSFAVNLPEPGVQAAYIDTHRTAGLQVDIFESDYGSYEAILNTWDNEKNAEYKACLESNLATDYTACTLKLNDAASRVGEAHILSHSNPTLSLSLEPGNYMIAVTQLDDANDDSTNFAHAITHVTLEDGQNDVEVNLLYGSWQFEQPIEFQVLNTPLSGIFEGVEGTSAFESDFGSFLINPPQNIWFTEYFGEPFSTAAQGLGLGYDFQIDLTRLHLTGHNTLKGYLSQPVQVDGDWLDLYFGEDSLAPEGMFEAWAPQVLVRNGITFESNLGHVGMGRTGQRTDGVEPSFHAYKGVVFPPTFAQQFASGSNQSFLDLGEVGIFNDELSESPVQIEAGFFFLTNHVDVDLEAFHNQAGEEINDQWLEVVNTTDLGSDEAYVAIDVFDYTTWPDIEFPVSTSFPNTRMVNSELIEPALFMRL